MISLLIILLIVCDKDFWWFKFSYSVCVKCCVCIKSVTMSHMIECYKMSKCIIYYHFPSEDGEIL